jgi:type IV pilus assembly protein PilC
MDFFQYKAMDSTGRVHNGKADAANVADLEMRLHKMGLDLINYKEVKSPAQSASGRGITRRDLLFFCFHLEQTSRAGVPILESLEDLVASTDNPNLKEVIAAMTESIEGGKTLSQAMQDYPGVFTHVFSSLVRAGEQTGEITKVFSKLNENMKWQDEMATQTKKLVTYPAFVGSVVIGVVIFLMVYLVPELLSFIKTMGQDIPAHTKALIFVSDIFVDYWYLILLTPVVVTIGIMLGVKFNPGFALTVDTLKMKTPVLGPIVRKIILARFASYFAMMYAAGITIIDCIRTGEEIAGNRAVAIAMHDVGQLIADGKSLSESFASTKLFPPLVLRMIKVGENTGALEESLENVAYFYTRDVREAIERLQTMIEPAMTVVLGAIIGWVMFSILGPIYDLIANIKI